MRQQKQSFAAVPFEYVNPTTRNWDKDKHSNVHQYYVKESTTVIFPVHAVEIWSSSKQTNVVALGSDFITNVSF